MFVASPSAESAARTSRHVESPLCALSSNELLPCTDAEAPLSGWRGRTAVGSGRGQNKGSGQSAARLGATSGSGQQAAQVGPCGPNSGSGQ
eukprot:4406109-Prymnesium_polylepis.1